MDNVEADLALQVREFGNRVERLERSLHTLIEDRSLEAAAASTGASLDSSSPALKASEASARVQSGV